MLASMLFTYHKPHTRRLSPWCVALLVLLPVLTISAWNALDKAALAASLQTGVKASPLDTATDTSTSTSTSTATSSTRPTNTRTFTNTPTATSTPPSCGLNANYFITAGTGSIVAGTTDIGNRCDDCTTFINLPFQVAFYNALYTWARVSSNGNVQFSTFDNPEYSNTCLPHTVTAFENSLMPHWDDLNTLNNPPCPGGVCGIFVSTGGVAPNRIFYIEWRATYLGTSSYVNFEVALYEAGSPIQSRMDFIYGAVPQGGSSATVGIQRDTGSQFTQFECSTGGLSTGLRLILTQPLCPTDTPTITRTPTITPTLTPTATVAPCGPTGNYGYSTSTGAGIVPGTAQTNSNCDDCTANISIPFPFSYYGTSFTNAKVSSNGNLQFSSAAIDHLNQCLTYANFNDVLLPYWDDLNTINNSACPSGVCGIFVSTTGVAPNRIFYVEWRATYFGTNTYINFEIALFENQSRIDFIYGTVPQNGSSATVGIQRGTGSQYTLYECSLGILSNQLRIAFTQLVCPTSTPTASPTSTPTITPTMTGTPTLTPTRTFTATPFPTVNRVLVGHVTWQGRPAQPSALQQLPISLTLKVGTTEVNYPPKTTDASGFFTVSVSSLVVGATFNWRAKGPDGVVKTLATDPPGFLANTGTIRLLNAAQTDLEIGQMGAGDCNNDNVVSAQDFNVLKGTFGKTLGDAGYDSRADSTGDHVVSSTDFNLLKGNFGQVGSPPLGPDSP